MSDTPETTPPPDTLPAQVDLKPKEMSMSSRGIQLESFEDAWRFVQIVHRAHMQPDQLKSPEMILVALQTGLELGLLPMQSIQSICVINGRPSIWGDSIPALIYASGQLEYIREELLHEGTDEMIAVCQIKRKGFPEIVQDFSLAEAKLANLYGNPKKQIWKQYPQRMLKMRARSWACRDLFADVLKGIAIAEEVQDYLPRNEPRQSDMDTTEPTIEQTPVHDAMMGPAKALPQPEADIELAEVDIVPDVTDGRITSFSAVSEAAPVDQPKQELVEVTVTATPTKETVATVDAEPETTDGGLFPNPNRPETTDQTGPSAEEMAEIQADEAKDSHG